jgi:hypothetical protein
MNRGFMIGSTHYQGCLRCTAARIGYWSNKNKEGIWVLMIGQTHSFRPQGRAYSIMLYTKPRDRVFSGLAA